MKKKRASVKALMICAEAGLMWMTGQMEPEVRGAKWAQRLSLIHI